MDTQLLDNTGFDYNPKDFSKKSIVLRDGRDAFIWVHKTSGHGILDSSFWERIEEDFYKKDYRDQSSTNSTGGFVEPSEHLAICKDLNKRQFQQFSKHVNRQTRYLEVGCSFGGVAKNVLEYGVEGCDVVEPNRLDAEFIKNNFDGIRVFNDLFENITFTNKYDIVASFEVLEHTISPIKFLEKCNELMNLGAIINIEVPNHDDILLYYNAQRYKSFFYHKAHIHYFTENSLMDACKIAGFEGSVSSFLYYPFFNHVFWLQNNKPQNSAREALFTPVPTKGTNIAEIDINDFYKETEKKYNSLINKHKLGDCLVFQGKKV